ncbi:hypothetical protein JMN32_23780 [Fulvivirga sp. 29W222]|uniref:Uncharacterized protein n=1 Tax=Fulvivirga marina TaxID=2494733 RepID=A0A937G2B7_9BACT|nr:hypothetical protein [Fulvivirga marina]MBL6449352.1 hypothetical protein [Fulvivirga marina]
MILLRQRSGPFHRIGDRYNTLFGSDHFMGRSAFEGNWMSKTNHAYGEKGKEVKLVVKVKAE